MIPNKKFFISCEYKFNILKICFYITKVFWYYRGNLRGILQRRRLFKFKPERIQITNGNNFNTVARVDSLKYSFLRFENTVGLLAIESHLCKFKTMLMSIKTEDGLYYKNNLKSSTSSGSEIWVWKLLPLFKVSQCNLLIMRHNLYQMYDKKRMA